MRFTAAASRTPIPARRPEAPDLATLATNIKPSLVVSIKVQADISQDPVAGPNVEHVAYPPEILMLQDLFSIKVILCKTPTVSLLRNIMILRNCWSATFRMVHCVNVIEEGCSAKSFRSEPVLAEGASVAPDELIRSQLNTELAGDPMHHWALRARDGDEAAAERLVEALSARLFRTAVLILQDRHQAEDALQESFWAAIEQADRFDGKVPFERWMHRIVVNRCYSFQRSPKQRRWLTVGDSDSEVFGADIDGISADGGRVWIHPSRDADFAWQTALADEVRQAMLQLPVHYRTVLVLHYYEDRPVTEIAEMLRLREGTVKSQLHRARRRMKRLLKEGGRNDADT